MVTNLEHFRITNRNVVEKLVPILFGNNKAFIQLGKSISNIRKIKYINIAFYNIKDKSGKGTIFLQ